MIKNSYGESIISTLPNNRRKSFNFWPTSLPLIFLEACILWRIATRLNYNDTIFVQIMNSLINICKANTNPINNVVIFYRYKNNINNTKKILNLY